MDGNGVTVVSVVKETRPDFSLSRRSSPTNVVSRRFAGEG